MPDKRGRPLKGEPGYETSAVAKSNAKNNAKNNAKRLRKGDPGYETLWLVGGQEQRQEQRRESRTGCGTIRSSAAGTR